MKRLCSCIAAGLFSLAAAAPAAAQDSYILFMQYETSREGLDGGGSGSSSGQQALSETVIATGEGVTEIEYSIPQPPEDVRGNAMWMYPARVLIADDGSKSVINREEVATRVDAWLKKAELSREACGQWIFTWTAIQILCDDNAIVRSAEAYGMRPGKLRDGSLLTLEGVEGDILLRKTGDVGDRIILSGKAPVDAEYGRMKQAESAVVVAGFSGEPLTIEDALAGLHDFNAVGTVTVELEVDADGLVWKRTDTTAMTVTGIEYGSEVRKATQTVTRYAGDDIEAVYADLGRN